MKYVFLLVVAFLQTKVSMAQTPASKNEFTPVLNHIAVYVQDLKKSTTFYEEVLRLKQIPEPFKDGLHTWFSLGGAGQLHLIQGKDYVVKRNKNEHLCFSVPSVDSFINHLAKFNIEYSNWPGTAKAPTLRVDGVKQIYFQDPDGHWLEINDDTKR